MAKAPAYQWYPKDILSSARVAELDLLEECAYRRALDFCWLNQSLPADPAKLARIIGKGCTPETAATIAKLFTPCPNDPTRLIHDRQEQEREKQAEWSRKASEAGKASATKRAAAKSGNKNSGEFQQSFNQNSTVVDGLVDVSLTPSTNINPTLQFASPSPSSYVGETPAQTDKSGRLKSEDVAPLPDSFAKSICERQMQKQGIQANQQNYEKMKAGVYEHWGGWLPVNITGDKHYNNVNEVYRHYYNRCEQLTILSTDPKKPNNERPIPKADAKAIAAKYT